MEFLPQANRDRILQLGSAHFDDGIKFLGLLQQGILQALQLLLGIVNELQGRHFAAGGEHVVCGLAEIHMVVGVYNRVVALFAAQDFNCAVGDYLVCVHVQGCAGTALDGVYDKLAVKLAGDDFVAGFYDGIGTLFIQFSHLKISDGSCLLDLGYAVDHFLVHLQAGNVKVLVGPKRLYAVVGIFRDFLFTDGVVL